MALEVSGILVAAHELKAPLCLMRQLALALNLTKNPDQATRLQQQLVEVSDRTLRQINDLTKIARLEDGLFTTEPVSVRGVCDAVLREIAPLFEFERQTLIKTYTNKSRLVIANRDLLYSIIYNFCVNALHYASSENSSELTVLERQGKVRVGVRDYGPALPTAIWRELKAGQIKQPTAIAMRPGSSGLGLYIASQFALHMHAQLGAVRHRDGTSFFIELPVSHQAMLAL